MPNPIKQHVSKRSVSLLWECPECNCQFRTLTRTSEPVQRKCKCGRVYIFGPTLPEGSISTTEFKSWDW